MKKPSVFSESKNGKQEWKALSEFPRWSDCPAPPPRDPDSTTYTPSKGKGDAQQRTIFLPQGTAERARILFVNEDWTALENEFELYSKSDISVRSSFKEKGDSRIMLMY